MSKRSNNIVLKLSHKKWEVFAEILRGVSTKAPIENWEVESCLLAEYYQRNIRALNYFIATKSGISSMSMKPSEAFAFWLILVHGEFVKDDVNPAVYFNEIKNQLPPVKL